MTVSDAPSAAAQRMGGGDLSDMGHKLKVLWRAFKAARPWTARQDNFRSSLTIN
jgi:hypothetical protein